jgi:tetratricopeptide (TPR) repeat protein
MNAVSTLDQQTANAIRQAIAAASAGRMSDAVNIGERALAGGGEPAALNAMLGTFQLRVGNLEACIRHLRVANSARPSDAVIATNLANALAKAGDHRGALDVLTEEIAAGDKSMQLQRLRAFLAQSADDYSAAIASYELVVKAVPDDWESWNNLGNAKRQLLDFAGAVAALERAAQLSPTSAPVRLNYATALGNAGRLQEAETELRKIADDFPSDTNSLVELHVFLKELRREEDALEAIERAVERDPRNIALLLGLASHRLSMLLNEKAEEAYRKAISLDPSNGQANLGLALVFELNNRAEELAGLVREAEARGVPANALAFIKAFDHRRARRYAEGLEAMAQVPEELESARRWHLLGQLHEGVGNYDEAFAAFQRMNEFQREEPTRPEERATAYRESIKLQTDTITPEWVGRWREGPQDDRPAPAFLVGFPRSGTTLLDTLLMGHPAAEVLEEEPTLLKAGAKLPSIAELPDISDEQIRAARDEYFRVAGALTPLAPGKLLIDKNPLSMNNLPIIRRVFPEAKIILALRHPCDVVLSCYVTNFKLNDGMANFIRLETAAELYDLSFRCFEKSQQLLDLPVHRVIYEKVVGDRESEMRSLLEFLGLEWSDDVLDHETTALNRGRIKTASYAQVAQPIYSRSAGRWTNYRKHLEPILPMLEPWIRKFGYSV